LAVAAALGLFVLLGIAALAVDLGMLVAARTQLETAADAAALAAAKELAFGARDHALRRAAEYARHNEVLGEPVELRLGNPNAPEDVVLGFYDLQARTFRPDDFLPNAVEVTTRRTENRATAVPTFFAAFFGRREVDRSAHSIAIGFPRKVVVAMDASGSMGGDENRGCGGSSPADIIAAREAAAEFLRDLGFSTLPERAGLVSFAREILVKVPIVGLHDPGQPANIVDRTLSIEAASCGRPGGTNTGLAIQEALDLFEDDDPSAFGLGQRMLVVLSDGLANVGRHGEEEYGNEDDPNNTAWRYAVESADEAREQGIIVHAIQLGNSDHPEEHEQQMRQIAGIGRQGEGRYLFAPDTEQLEEMFETLRRHVQVALVD
jgi:hypothetical protein